MLRFAEKPQIFLTIHREAIDEESGCIEHSIDDPEFS
jgi:hypothetical protein